jgi:hypothetical protein
MTLPFGKTALLLGAAALLAPVTASAQNVRDLNSEVSDVLIFEGSVRDEPVVFRYSMAAESSLIVDVIPTGESELDPMVSITDADTGEVLAEDDDGGEGLASRAVVFASEPRSIEITVSAFAFFSGEESAGAFELKLRPGDQTPEPLRAIAFGEQASGTLDGENLQLFSITGSEGELLQVALVADGEDLDPMLTLYSGEGTFAEELASDDDGGEGLNSLLRFVLPADGTYTIAAQSYSGTSGGYTMRVGPPRTHTIQPPQQVLGLGEAPSGYIGAGYENGSLDPSTITYQLTEEAIAAIRAGSGEVTINMTAQESEDPFFPSTIDPYIEVGFETPLGYATVLNDDDGGEGLNSRLVVDLGSIASDGDWLERLRITASSIGEGGAFELEITEGGF